MTTRIDNSRTIGAHRRGHGLLTACRHGDRLRRHAGGHTPHRARAVERSGERRRVHADGGYEDAIACAREKGLKLLNI